ncbi:hypothetical protein PoB_007080800 [Plakobranchus ocellatus]|uniref:Uncharacterized protein n=1 Tax=Plakobranchus ocellatus TaxID=259542 RepID=A0AAV4DJR8_9GAST|nr:hypothetical protein PoB_007080800 [Plakobranchus ocellatus]
MRARREALRPPGVGQIDSRRQSLQLGRQTQPRSDWLSTSLPPANGAAGLSAALPLSADGKGAGGARLKPATEESFQISWQIG